MPPHQPTIVTSVIEAARQLARAGFHADGSRREAALLAREALGWDSAQYLVRQHEPTPAGFVDQLAEWTSRRIAREPIAYIVGRREFYGRAFTVTPDVLIPRPETELLVDVALEFVRAEKADDGPCDIVDVGTGSGCLAVTLALELPRAHLTATDVSPAALRVAGENAARLGAGDRVTYVHAPLAAGAIGTCDILVSNPPYVATVDRDALAADVRDYEPATALFGGPDGLDVIRALVPAAHRALRPGALLAIEIGCGQADDVRALFTTDRWTDVRVRSDLAGVPRVIAARRIPGRPDP